MTTQSTALGRLPAHPTTRENAAIVQEPGFSPAFLSPLAKVDQGGPRSALRLEVPGAAVLGLFSDPAGNRMGLVEMDGDKAKVP